jgi:hypothetical protein
MEVRPAAAAITEEVLQTLYAASLYLGRAEAADSADEAQDALIKTRACLDHAERELRAVAKALGAGTL